MGVVGRFGAAISGTRGIRRGSCRGRVRLGAFLMLRDTPAAAIWGEMRVALAQGSFTSLHARGRQHDPDCRNSIANSGIYYRYRGSLPAYTAVRLHLPVMMVSSILQRNSGTKYLIPGSDRREH